MKRGLVIAGVAIAGLAAAGAAWFFSAYPSDKVEPIADELENFKYGSIGGDTDSGLPVRLLEVLPGLFPDLMPPGGAKDYSAFGLVQEPGHAMPVGFSTRVRTVPLVGFNCAVCHTGIVRTAPDAEPMVIYGMGSTTLDIGGYFGFLFKVAKDPRFEADAVLTAMDAKSPLSFVDRIIYRRVIQRFKDRLGDREKQLGPIFAGGHPPFGPGRVDTFNPYKLTQLGHEYPNGLTAEESVGTARYASIWDQSEKRDRPLNWDGNAPRVQDRNVGAAFGAGATPESLDLAALDRVQKWLEKLPVPKWPFPPKDAAAVARGGEVFAQLCNDCHGAKGKRLGEILPVALVGTDPSRHASYTEKLNTLFLKMGEGKPWKLEKMQTTAGYVNRPLDGIWARAPYLHNGAVPTLWDLMLPEDQRNGGQPTFLVGHAVYDQENVGMRTDVAKAGGLDSHVFDLRLPGNSNRGHSGPVYGTDLPDEDKRALIAYMTTL